MSAELVSPLNEHDVDYMDPSNKYKFFSGGYGKKIRTFQERESPPTFNPAASCNTNLFFGFFHDGTRNSYGESLKTKNHAHTNVARLYSSFPGRSMPGVIASEPEWKHQPDQFKHFFRVKSAHKTRTCKNKPLRQTP